MGVPSRSAECITRASKEETMKKSEFISQVAQRSGLSKKDTEAVIEAALDTITDALKARDNVSFLGFGIPPPTPDWGFDIHTGQKFLLAGDWWLITFPGMMIILLSLGFGIMTAYASYLPKDADQVQNSATIGFLNCSFEFIAGLAVFSLLFVFAVVPKASTLSMMFHGRVKYPKEYEDEARVGKTAEKTAPAEQTSAGEGAASGNGTDRS